MTPADNFKDIEHRFDQKFYNTTAQKFAKYYISGAFEEAPRLEGLEHLASIPKNMNRLYVALHKSLLDPIIIPHLLHEAGEKPMVIAAGDNLFRRIGPLDFDKWIRKCGGYKIIREPETYSEALRVTKQRIRYTTKLLENGEDILIFAESGRSDTGKIIDFAPGAMCTSPANKAKRPLAIIPVAETYERIPEDRSISGVKLFKKEVKQIKNKKIRKLRKLVHFVKEFGEVYVQRHMNHSLGNAVVRIGEPYIYNPDGDAWEAEKDKMIISGMMQERCGELVELTPTSLTAHAIVDNQKASLDEVLSQIERDYDSLSVHNVPRTLVPINDPPEIFDRGMKFLKRFVSVKGDKVLVKRPDAVGYYANNIDHHYGKVPVSQPF